MDREAWRTAIHGVSKSQTRLSLIGGVMLSKVLIQFSVDGWSCVPSLLFTWAQTMVEVMKKMVTSFKGPMHALLHSVPPTLHQATANPHLLCQKLLDQVAQMVKNLSAMQETWVQSLGQKDPLEKGMATHSSILA